jgi:hypothetical protein
MLLGKSEFAKHIGHHPSHITKMIGQGRIVLSGSGPRAKVKVEESIALMKETEGGRPDVAIRNAVERNEKKAATSHDGEFKSVGASYQTARAVREKYAALTAKAQYETMIGNLIEREDVDACLRFIGATVRSLMDSFPDQNAPVLCAETDIHEIHAMLTDACRAVLEDIGLAIERQKKTITRG